MEPTSNGGPAERPFAIVEKDRGALRIAALNPVSARAGLNVGMMLAEAKVLVANLETVAAAPQADADFLRFLADNCEMFTPLVALQGKDGIILDITGCVNLFGAEKDMLLHVRRRLAGLGVISCGAIAGTPDAAWAFARYRRNTIAVCGEETILARDLPVEALGQDGQITLALSRAGLRTLGALADRPFSMLAARFGSDLVVALRRILGGEDVRITPLRTAPDIMSERHFPEPLGLLESLFLVIERLARDVVEALERRGEGLRSFEVSFFRSDGEVRRILVQTGQATREAGNILRLVRLKLEALTDPLDPGYGFDALRFSVLRSETLRPIQQTFQNKAEYEAEEAEVANLLDRLVARFGAGSVRHFILRDTHDPVRAGSSASCFSYEDSGFLTTPQCGDPPVRPLTLFDPPQWIEAMAGVPDGPPMRFRWRRVLHEVARAEGPERIAAEWWRAGNSAPATRDYYRVENALGHRFWIFREGLYEDTNARPRWFLHGLFA